jgi:hypothetical protein
MSHQVTNALREPVPDGVSHMPEPYPETALPVFSTMERGLCDFPAVGWFGCVAERTIVANGFDIAEVRQ